MAGEVPDYGNTREIGFMCLLRLCLAVAIRQAECRSVLAQREMEKGRSSFVQFRPSGAGIFCGTGGVSAEDAGAARCQRRESHEPQWSLQNWTILLFLPIALFSSENFGARIAS